MLKKLTVFLFIVFIGLGLTNLGSQDNISIIGKGPSPGSLIHPSGITVHKTSLWVCDVQQSRIFQYDIRTKELVSARGSGSLNLNSTLEPEGICFDEKDQCYVLCKDMLYCFNDQFVLTKKLSIPGLLTDIIYKSGKIYLCNYTQNEVLELDAKSFKILNKFAVGNGPVSIAWNSSNELLVSEVKENRISFYNEKGQKTRTPLPVDKSSIIAGIRVGLNDWIYMLDTHYYKVYAYSKGGGSKYRDFNIPGETVRCWKEGLSGFLVLESEVWVASPVQRAVIVYSEDGKLKREYGILPKDDELVFPASMVVSQNNLYIADCYAGTVKHYDWKGDFIGIFGNKRGQGRLDFPVGLVQDEEKNLFVLNAHSAVYQFDEYGKYLKEISGKYSIQCATDIDYYKNNLFITDRYGGRILQVNTLGAIVKEWKGFPGLPVSLSITPYGQFYITFYESSKVAWYDASGELIQLLQHETLKKPMATYCYNDQVLLISDGENHNISLWVYKNGLYQYTGVYGEPGGPSTESYSNPPSTLDFTDETGKFMQPANIDCDGNFFYVLDQKNQRIQRIAKGLILEKATLPEEEKLVVEPEKLNFGRVKAGDPAIQKLSIRGTGSTKIEGKLSTNQNWIRLGKLTFSGDTDFSVNIDTNSLSEGEHTGNVIIESNLGTVSVMVVIYIEGGEIEPPPAEPELIRIILVINQPKAMVNDKECWIDSTNHKITPVILPPGRTFVPIRFISEAFGAEVGWDSATQSVRIFLPSKDVRITLQINNKIAKVNNNIVTLDAPPTILYSRTFVPLRFIAEAFGAQILWDGSKQQITIELEI